MAGTEWDNRKMVAEFEQALLSLNRVAAMNVLNAAIASDKPIRVIEHVVAQALEHIGAGWEEGRVALSQVYMSGRICEELLEQILPPESSLSRHHSPMAIAVLEDYHQPPKVRVRRFVWWEAAVCYDPKVITAPKTSDCYSIPVISPTPTISPTHGKLSSISGVFSQPSLVSKLHGLSLE